MTALPTRNIRRYSTVMALGLAEFLSRIARALRAARSRARRDH
jgi:hypothetical protein